MSKVYADGDLRVNVDNKTWTFNPLCVVPISTGTVNYDDRTQSRTGPASHHDTHRHSTRDDNTPISNTALQHTEAPPTQLHDPALLAANHIAASGAPPTVPPHINRKLVDKLVREAAQGHLSNVNALLALHPELLECGSNEKTALQVACHQGHLPVVRFLLDRGAKPGTQDQDGDTSLHYAAFGNQVEVSIITSLSCVRYVLELTFELYMLPFVLICLIPYNTSSKMYNKFIEIMVFGTHIKSILLGMPLLMTMCTTGTGVVTETWVLN